MSPLIDEDILEEVYELVKSENLKPSQVVDKLGLKISPKALSREFINFYGVSCSEVCGYEKTGRKLKRKKNVSKSN